MDAFDYQDNEAEPSREGTILVLNILTGLVLLVTVVVLVVFFVFLINPHSTLNPFPPQQMPVLASSFTATPTARVILPPTWTPTVTPNPTETPVPTETQIPTDIPTATPALSVQVSPNPTIVGGMPFVLQQGNPVAIPNIAHPNLGCNWTGVAGQALGLNEAPVVGLLVKLEGTLAGKPVNLLGMTGTATQYGMGGYEFTLADHLVASRNSLTIQLFDQAMIALSDKVSFDTFEDCNQALIHINFKQVK